MRQTTDEQLEAIWSAAQAQDIYAERTVTHWDDPIVIFESWRDVEKMGDIVKSLFPQEFAEHTPTLAKYDVDPRHYIEWAIGDIGFSDQFQTCSHCYHAIDTSDMLKMWYFNQDAGDLVCIDCIRTERDFADEYLTYCARHMEGKDSYDQEIAQDWINPIDFGYRMVNPYSVSAGMAHKYDLLCNRLGLEELVDHPSYPSALTYGKPEEISRLAKAVKLIDSDIVMFAMWNSGTYSASLEYWVKWDDNSDYHSDQIDPALSSAILDYALSRIFWKYGELSRKALVTKEK